MADQTTANRNGIRRAIKLLIGVFVLAAGLIQVRSMPSSWVSIMFAVCAILFGLEYVYSAVMGRWVSPLGAATLAEFLPQPRRFQLVEPSLVDPPDGDANEYASESEPSTNPYAPPQRLASVDGNLHWQHRESALKVLTQRFLSGQPFIHQGVVLFIEPADSSTIHAALPLLSPTPTLIELNVQEAQRALPDFLNQLPQVMQAVQGRTLVVRMIASYEQLEEEVAERVVLGPSTLLKRE